MRRGPHHRHGVQRHRVQGRRHRAGRVRGAVEVEHGRARQLQRPRRMPRHLQLPQVSQSLARRMQQHGAGVRVLINHVSGVHAEVNPVYTKDRRLMTPRIFASLHSPSRTYRSLRHGISKQSSHRRRGPCGGHGLSIESSLYCTASLLYCRAAGGLNLLELRVDSWQGKSASSAERSAGQGRAVRWDARGRIYSLLVRLGGATALRGPSPGGGVARVRAEAPSAEVVQWPLHLDLGEGGERAQQSGDRAGGTQLKGVEVGTQPARRLLG